MPIYEVFNEATIETKIDKYKFHFEENEGLNHSARVKIMFRNLELGSIPSLPNHKLDFDETYSHDKCKISDDVPEEVSDLAVCFAVYGNDVINEYFNNPSAETLKNLNIEFKNCRKEFGNKISTSKARKIANEKRDKDMEK